MAPEVRVDHVMEMFDDEMVMIEQIGFENPEDYNAFEEQQVWEDGLYEEF